MSAERINEAMSRINAAMARIDAARLDLKSSEFLVSFVSAYVSARLWRVRFCSEAERAIGQADGLRSRQLPKAGAGTQSAASHTMLWCPSEAKQATFTVMLEHPANLTLQDVPALESRIDEARAAIKEDRILECSTCCGKS